MAKLLLTSSASVTLPLIKSLLSKDLSKCTVAFIPTAADPNDDKFFVIENKTLLLKMGFKVTEYDLKGKKNTFKDLEQFDVIFVCGGSTRYLLDAMQKSGFDKALPKLLKKEIVYAGSSAGSVVLGPMFVTTKDLADQSIRNVTSFEGLGIIDFVILPHADRPKYAERKEKAFLEYKNKFDLRPLNDNQAIIIEGKKVTLVTV